MFFLESTGASAGMAATAVIWNINDQKLLSSCLIYGELTLRIAIELSTKPFAMCLLTAVAAHMRRARLAKSATMGTL